MTIHTPANSEELAELIQAADGTDRRFDAVGGGTCKRSGRPLDCDVELISMSALDSIVEFPADDLTITVGAGVTIATLNDIVSNSGLQLPIDVPQASQATVGGILACNVSGPRRYGYGTLRDFLIGIEAVDGRGRLFHAGGKVVKNVAGYDLCKLMCGSLGTLGLLTEATFKLAPQLASRKGVLIFPEDLDDADLIVECLLHSETRPVAVELLGSSTACELLPDHDIPVEQPVLLVLFEGTDFATQWQVEQLTGELTPLSASRLIHLSAEESTSALRHLTNAATESDDELRFRAAILPSAMTGLITLAESLRFAVRAHAMEGIVHGVAPLSLFDQKSATESILKLRAESVAGLGHIAVTQCPDEWCDDLPMQGDPAVGAGPLSFQVKHAFDPEGKLAPGRIRFDSTAM